MTTTRTSESHPLDVIVIGAGQAGLAIGYHLRQGGAHFRILDAGSEVGHVWRSRWDSLRLFTPARYDALPGTPFPAPAGAHPSKDQVADYLAAYAVEHQLPVQLDTRVTRLSRDPDGFTVQTSRGPLRARQVVVATGPFQTPHIPPVAGELPADVPQLHSAQYGNPGRLPRGAQILVVGAANSGLQIAAELAETSSVTVAVGSRPPELPQRVLGRDLFSWLDRIGFMSLSSTSRLGRRIRARGDIVIGTRTATLRSAGVEFRPRLTGFTGRTAHFADGTETRVDAVVWATGYRSDYSWLDLPEVLDGGRPRQRAGVTDVPGLYFLGLPWQSTRGSSLLGFVARDAVVLAGHIAGHRDRAVPATGGTHRPVLADKAQSC